MVVRQRQHVDRGADSLGDHLPGYDVAVMLQHRQQDAVAGLQLRHSPALRDEVDPFGRAAGEDDLVGSCRADEARDLLARGFIGQRHVGGTLVHAAVDGRIGLAIGAGNRVEHGLRLLRGGGGVEIRPAGGDRGEVGEPVERGFGGGHATAPHARKWTKWRVRNPSKRPLPSGEGGSRKAAEG
ncbi:hypothetical protein WR25_16511 [Diploscapter pachys]|uniref:Uncharacterized protein n=1 Tax=Diploscapter pachys TaxID=2018661 RepID=A0A2A2M5B3_9BILA|nr:hypothetical protein WR25_16511 [Diploscapter pachys]